MNTARDQQQEDLSAASSEVPSAERGALVLIPAEHDNIPTINRIQWLWCCEAHGQINKISLGSMNPQQAADSELLVVRFWCTYP